MANRERICMFIIFLIAPSRISQRSLIPPHCNSRLLYYGPIYSNLLFASLKGSLHARNCCGLHVFVDRNSTGFPRFDLTKEWEKTFKSNFCTVFTKKWWMWSSMQFCCDWKIPLLALSMRRKCEKNSQTSAFCIQHIVNCVEMYYVPWNYYRPIKIGL